MSEQPAASAPAECLQDTVLHLQWFWAGKGCLLLPPCDFAVPFATLHSDVFFGVLGEEPWRTVFVQPIRRPLDGRFGEHPYRLGKHLQLQVVLRPPPADVQQLYMESLEAIGLALPDHDLRFSEWNWRPSSLGARGSGWHALLDGLGVTRLTFLERLADRRLDPPCLEISYGLERLVMTLQGAASVFRLGWSADGIDYRRLRQPEEGELTRYAFEVADPGALRRRLQVLEDEADRCLAFGLARSAYELTVRCLEPIDLLEARGELSARERAEWRGRVRARVVAAAEIAQKPAAPKPGKKRGRSSPSGPAKKKRRAKRAKKGE